MWWLYIVCVVIQRCMHNRHCSKLLLLLSRSIGPNTCFAMTIYSPLIAAWHNQRLKHCVDIFSYHVKCLYIVLVVTPNCLDIGHDLLFSTFVKSCLYELGEHVSEHVCFAQCCGYTLFKWWHIVSCTKRSKLFATFYSVILSTFCLVNVFRYMYYTRSWSYNVLVVIHRCMHDIHCSKYYVCCQCA